MLKKPSLLAALSEEGIDIDEPVEIRYDEPVDRTISSKKL